MARKNNVPTKYLKALQRENQLRLLVQDLWWFIENVGDETPDRTERFFALRERVRSLTQ